jgi:hypothetical protein
LPLPAAGAADEEEGREEEREGAALLLPTEMEEGAEGAGRGMPFPLALGLVPPWLFLAGAVAFPCMTSMLAGGASWCCGGSCTGGKALPFVVLAGDDLVPSPGPEFLSVEISSKRMDEEVETSEAEPEEAVVEGVQRRIVEEGYVPRISTTPAVIAHTNPLLAVC